MYADSNAVSSFVVNNFLTIGLNIVLIVFIFIILFSINGVSGVKYMFAWGILHFI